MRHGELLEREGEKTVQIVHRIACVLRAFDNRGLLGITEIASTTGLPKSTIHRLVTALVSEGLLMQDEDSHKYALSLRLTAFSANILSSHVVRKSARPLLMELRDQTHESVHLAVLEGMEVVIIDTEEFVFCCTCRQCAGTTLTRACRLDRQGIACLPVGCASARNSRPYDAHTLY